MIGSLPTSAASSRNKPDPDRHVRRFLPAMLGAMLAFSCSPASAFDAECAGHMQRLNRAATAKYFSCRKGGFARTADCIAKLGGRLVRSTSAVQLADGQAGFLCPASGEALGLAGPWSWPVRLLESDADGGIGECSGAQKRLARKFAIAFGRCLERHASDPAGFDTCAASARSALLSKWTAADPSSCPSPRAEPAMARIEFEMHDSLSRLLVACDDDAYRFDRCDDGNAVDGDGCNADCRAESCGRVGETVECVVCPSDSEAVETFDGCRCRAGSEGEPGACVVFDECLVHGGACPEGRPCVNLRGTWACAIPCDAASFHGALASCGAPSGAIAFNCLDTTIAVPAGTTAMRSNACDDLTIDGTDRNITFELDPVCWQTPIAAERCPAGLEPDGTCWCPDIDSGEPFLSLRGDRNVVRNLTVRGFFEGVPVRGRSNVVEDVRFDRMCDDAFGSVVTGVGNLFRRLTVTNGCDKCSENGGSLEDTDPDPRVAEHFHATISDVAFEGCRTPVRVASSGRFRLENVRMGPGTAEFPCDGPRFTAGTDAARVVVEMTGSTVEGCRRGIRLGRGVEATLRDSRIADCSLRGLHLASTARASIEGVTFEDNGGGGSSEPGFGGVAITEQAEADLGGGSVVIDGQPVTSLGENSLCDNRAPDGSRRDLDAPLDRTTSASGNWWCTPSPADRIAGAAVVDPVLGSAPLRYRP